MTPLHLPEGLDRADFLRDYWQKRPLLMPAALPAGSFTLSPDELAGLACEPTLESRILIQRDTTHWELHHGPFDTQDFTALPPSRWTLLVQDVDKYLPEVAALIDPFDFVPAWRIDDIMVSYAADQGGVGPHSDAYDVFLMQAHGTRRWRISHRVYAERDLLPDLDVRILAGFDTDEEWLLEPGDILYLPPGVAHWGIAEGDCLTYSLGFRSPSQQDLAADWFQYLVAQAGTRQLVDPADLRGDSPAEITAGLIGQATRLIGDLPTPASVAFRTWLGCHLTEPKPQFRIEPPSEPWTAHRLDACLAGDHGFRRHLFARLAWTELDAQALGLFYQGEVLTLPADQHEIVKSLAGLRHLDAGAARALAAASSEARAALLQLLNAGILTPDEARA